MINRPFGLPPDKANERQNERQSKLSALCLSFVFFDDTPPDQHSIDAHRRTPHTRLHLSKASSHSLRLSLSPGTSSSDWFPPR
eukprot:680554-Prorocentrum_minimum.AAC.1